MIALRSPQEAIAMLALALLFALQTAPAPASAPALSIQDEAKALLTRLAERQSSVKSMRSSYVQERKSALLKDPLVSKGTFLWRKEPGCVVFEVAEPKRARIRLDAASYQVFRPDDRQAERFEFESNDLGKALLQSLSPNAGEMEKGFSVVSFTRTDGRAEVALEPQVEKMKAFLTAFRIVVREDDMTIEEIAYTDGQGDEVKIRIEKLERDPPLDDSAFDAALPPGTELLVHKVEKKG